MAAPLAICIALAAPLVIAQPLTPSELAWPSAGACAGTNYGGLSYYIIPENSNFTNFLAGGGSGPLVFTITTNPASGAATLLSAATGSNYYAPNNNFLGYDQYAYVVNLQGCSRTANGFVALTVTNGTAEGCGYWYLTNASATCFLPGFVGFTLIVQSTSQALFDTNICWTFTISDQDGDITTSTWVYYAKTAVTQWVPGVSGGCSPCVVTFDAGVISCPPIGDVITGALCPYTPGTNCDATATNVFISMATNSSASVTLAGHGGGFAITQYPTNGTVTGFSPAAGTFTYNETNAGAVTDLVQYVVLSSHSCCSTSAVVSINITNACPPFCYGTSATVTGASTDPTANGNYTFVYQVLTNQTTGGALWELTNGSNWHLLWDNVNNGGEYVVASNRISPSFRTTTTTHSNACFTGTITDWTLFSPVGGHVVPSSVTINAVSNTNSCTQ